MPEFPVLLDMDEACELLRCKKDWLYDQVRAKKIPGLKIGRKIYFLEEDLATWLRERSKDQSPL